MQLSSHIVSFLLGSGVPVAAGPFFEQAEPPDDELSMPLQCKFFPKCVLYVGKPMATFSTSAIKVADITVKPVKPVQVQGIGLALLLTFG